MRPVFDYTLVSNIKDQMDAQLLGRPLNILQYVNPELEHTIDSGLGALIPISTIKVKKKKKKD